MRKKASLHPNHLRSSYPPERIPYASSDDIPKKNPRKHPQPRMMEALKLGLHIKTCGYNIFLAGDPDLGRRHMLTDYLLPKARKEQSPPDYLYVYNFSNPDAPRLLLLPAGFGQKIKKTLTQIITKIQKEMTVSLEKDVFTSKRSTLLQRLQNKRSRLLKSMNKMASEQGFHISLDDSGGMLLFPTVNGKKLNDRELEDMNQEERDNVKQRGDSLMEPLTGLMRKLVQAEQGFLEKERSLEREILDTVLKVTFDPVLKTLFSKADSPDFEKHCTEMRQDMLENHFAFIAPIEATPEPFPPIAPSMEGLHAPEDIHSRYAINIFVDSSNSTGAPIVFEDNPTLGNLMGSIEREAEMGALVTHFSLIKAGAIHKANGGYLILHAEDILRHSGAWEALIRSLRSGLSRIEDSGEDDSAKTKGLHPEPVPLSLKVILVGDEGLYEMLLTGDERFSKLFKIKAHLTDNMLRDKTGVHTYLCYIRRIIDDNKLLPFTQCALAALVDYGSRIIEDQNKLSLMFPLLRDMMVEASAFAELDGNATVDAGTIEKAQDARSFRNNLIEEIFMEEYDRHIIKVTTRGEAIGRVNGLAVSMYGDFEFGLPHQISCTVGAGSGGIIDLERDAQLGGPIHTKAMMILKTYLVGSFAHNKPLILTGSLGFEQNYVGIEGDSASGAELAALLSALAGIPATQALAFTGAVGQSGEIMAVGGITRKIEGYFEVCKRHGLTGDQGVIMPHDNCPHLMLHSDIVEAVAKDNFHIYTVRHINEAMEILTGLPAGRLRKNGRYTAGSLYDLVDRRLTELAKISKNKLLR